VRDDGFYISDWREGDLLNDYGHIYVYTYSNPDLIEEEAEGPVDIKVGQRLIWISGNVTEFYGLTEIGFPVWSWKRQQDGTIGIHRLPEPVTVTAQDVINPERMEALESAPVIVQDVRVGNFSETCSDYLQYGQWPVELGQDSCGSVPVGEWDCRNDVNNKECLLINSNKGRPEGFDPAEYKGKCIKYIKGNLRHVMPKYPRKDVNLWIIETDSPDDIHVGDGSC
jgi:hypothetical protein